VKQNSNDAAAWLTKAEALRALKVSERSLDRMVTAGKVQKQTRPRPGRPPEPLFNASDIERLTAREAFAIQPAGEPGAKQLAPSPAAPSLPLPAFLAILDQLGGARSLAPAAQACAIAPAWLDLESASAHSGLSARLLRRLITTGDLPALKDGRAWKVCRDDLAALRASNTKLKVKGAHA